jgi:hypothetical protein
MKAYLSKEKIVSWFMKNDRANFLLAKLRNGETVEGKDDTTYNVSWIDEHDGREVRIDKRDSRLIRIIDTQATRLGDGYERFYSLEIEQPEENAWIEWK